MSEASLRKKLQYLGHGLERLRRLAYDAHPGCPLAEEILSRIETIEENLEHADVTCSVCQTVSWLDDATRGSGGWVEEGGVWTCKQCLESSAIVDTEAGRFVIGCAMRATDKEVTDDGEEDATTESIVEVE
jgi:hypothetical protein